MENPATYLAQPGGCLLVASVLIGHWLHPVIDGDAPRERFLGHRIKTKGYKPIVRSTVYLVKPRPLIATFCRQRCQGVRCGVRTVREDHSPTVQTALPSACMRSKPVCHLHGGKGGGPKGEKNGAYRTGRYTAEAKAERREQRALIRELQRLIDAGSRVSRLEKGHFIARAVFDPYRQSGSLG